MANNRQQFDDQTKRETVRAIVSGEQSINDAAKKLSLQSYQLHAWLGYALANEPEMVYELLDARFQKQHGDTGALVAEMTQRATTGDFDLALMEAYLRRKFGRPS